MVDSLCRLLKVGVLRLINVHELAGITVDHGKPRALDLYHNPVTPLEHVEDVLQNEIDLCWAVRFKGIGM